MSPINSLYRLKRVERQNKRQSLLKLIPENRLKDFENPLEKYNAADFKQRYHIFKETAVFVAELIKKDLNAPIRRGVYVPPAIQFLTVQRYFATGSTQLVLADLDKTNQPNVCHLIKRVSTAIAKHCKTFIRWPTFEEAEKVREGFFKIAGFPGVVGCIDGTHVGIESPGGEDAELYRNRKQTFSINVQGVTDHELNFINIVARWYGSAHDMRIFQNSFISTDLETGRIPGILLGDAGYACLPYLMTPLASPTSRPQMRYNKAQIGTRNTAERLFGVWKRRFPCVAHKCRIRKIKTVLTVIVATAILHNISRRRADIMDDDAVNPPPAAVEQSDARTNDSSISGRAKRDAIIVQYFS